MDETVAYTVSVLQDLRDQLTRLGLQDQVEIEIEVQTGDGSHLFEILNKVSDGQAAADGDRNLDGGWNGFGMPSIWRSCEGWLLDGAS